MDRSNKKRISHVGPPISKEKSHIMTDVVADIMKKMDSSISDSEFFKILNIPTIERSSGQGNLDMHSAFPTQPSIASQKQKKFLANKRHPLMEKAQKSKNYIKHNRSLPKPRAHLGGFGDSVQKKKDEIGIKKSFSSSNSKKSSGSSHLEKTRKSSGAFAKSWQSRSNGDNNTIISDENVSDVSSKLPVSSSESESDFESFIQAHKNDTELDDQRNRKKGKKETKRKTLKQTKCTKSKKPKSIELESEDKKSLPGSQISSKVTATNRQKLPETSDSAISSTDENESSNSLFETRKASSATHRWKLPETSNSSLSSADENESSNSLFKTGKSSSATNRQLPERSNSSVSSADENESSKSFFGKEKASAIKVTSTNRQKLPETSDCSVSSADEKESSNRFFETVKDSPLSCFENEYGNTNKLCKQSVSDNLMCTVRIERNPHLDKAVTLSNPPLDEIYDFSSEPQGSNEEIMTECSKETTLDSDDDCLIVCEVPKSDDHANVSVAEGGGPESDIQILNVVSLGESRKVIDTNDRNTVSLTHCFSRDENSCGVDSENSKKVIKDTRGSNFSAPQEETLITELNNSNPTLAANVTGGRMQNITDCNFNRKVYPPVSTDVINTVNKIDLKEILLLANNASNNKSSPGSKVFDPLPCSSSSTDSSFSCLPSKKSEIITEKHWQNLKKAVGMDNYSTYELHAILDRLKSDSVNFNHIKLENLNSLENEDNSSREPSAIVPHCNLSASALKEIISNAEQLPRANGENTLKKDYYEDPCEELDNLGATSIQELWPNESSQNISQLLHVYSQQLQEYNEIKNSEESLTYSLKLLQDSLEAKRKNLETVLEHLMKKDPCFYADAKSNQETVVNYNKTSSIQNTENEVSSKQVKNCVNCGSKATIVCDKCNKVYFCTEKCGVFYWENGHYKSCEGTR